jgi:hypothetical protein
MGVYPTPVLEDYEQTEQCRYRKQWRSFMAAPHHRAEGDRRKRIMGNGEQSEEDRFESPLGMSDADEQEESGERSTNREVFLQHILPKEERYSREVRRERELLYEETGVY